MEISLEAKCNGFYICFTLLFPETLQNPQKYDQSVTYIYQEKLQIKVFGCTEITVGFLDIVNAYIITCKAHSIDINHLQAEGNFLLYPSSDK